MEHADPEELTKFDIENGDKGSEENSDNTSGNTDDSTVIREHWGGKYEFMLSLVGYTVGLGNLWRFPFFCYKNGGGIAIIPFLLFLILCGGPLYYMEVCLGQFSGKSPITVWNICPLFKGIGLVMISCSLIYVWYFGTAFGWVFYFLFQSFYPTLPWSNCDNEWNTELCIDARTNTTFKMLNLTTTYNKSSDDLILRTSGTEFWERKVLNKSSGIDDMGSIQLHLVGCLFLGWFLIFLCLAKGVKSLGKVVYVTATLPYILLTVLLVRGVTLDGAWGGLKLYFIPDFSKLANANMWMEAAVQCFYSLGPAWGGLITMASFNKFNHNVLRDTVIACFADGFTAIYGGIIVFSVLGFLSKETGTPMDKLPFSAFGVQKRAAKISPERYADTELHVIDMYIKLFLEMMKAEWYWFSEHARKKAINIGAGLAFIAYPEALSRLPAPNVWAVLFFVTLALVGVDTQFGIFETAANAIIDSNYNTLHKYRLFISGALATFLFVTGIPITMSGGYYVFMLIDWYVAYFNILLAAFLECVVVAWIYGANRFSGDIELMVGSRPPLLIRIVWCFIIPLFIGGILITTISSYSAPTVGYDYPMYALVLGNIIAFGPVVGIVLVFVYQILKRKGTLIERVRDSIKPDKTWWPNDSKQKEISMMTRYHYSDGCKNRFLDNILGWTRH